MKQEVGQEDSDGSTLPQSRRTAWQILEDRHRPPNLISSKVKKTAISLSDMSPDTRFLIEAGLTAKERPKPGSNKEYELAKRVRQAAEEAKEHAQNTYIHVGNDGYLDIGGRIQLATFTQTKCREDLFLAVDRLWRMGKQVIKRTAWSPGDPTACRYLLGVFIQKYGEVGLEERNILLGLAWIDLKSRGGFEQNQAARAVIDSVYGNQEKFIAAVFDARLAYDSFGALARGYLMNKRGVLVAERLLNSPKEPIPLPATMEPTPVGDAIEGPTEHLTA